jgi:hypothetical protein
MRELIGPWRDFAGITVAGAGATTPIPAWPSSPDEDEPAEDVTPKSPAGSGDRRDCGCALLGS